MPRRINPRSGGFSLAMLLLAGVAIPALAQDRPESILPPGFGEAPAPAPQPATPTPSPSPAAPATQPNRPSVSSALDSLVEAVNALTADELGPDETPRPPVEYPDDKRRDPQDAGVLPAAGLGLGEQPWGGAYGPFLEVFLRRMDAPLPLRWSHISLRNTLMVKGAAPHGVNPADWAAERAWLLLRMGEADAASLMVASMDSDRYTDKMVQVAAQAALATSDPSGLCPLEERLAKVEKKVSPLVGAICASLAGESESAAANIEQARRRGRVGGIDLALADKLVGAGAESARAVTIEWEPVNSLNAWRYGLATATGMMPPQRLFDRASPQLRAWLARSPIIPAAQRVEAARTAAGIGVLSSQAMLDLQGAIYDATDPDALGETDAWKLRQAFVGKDVGARLNAMRALWKEGDGPVERHAAFVMTARAASLVAPDADLQDDAPNLIAAMLAGGFDRAAARWAGAIRQMDDEQADRCWAMLALASPGTQGIDLAFGRITSFADRDESKDQHRTRMLVAALAGLGRINPDQTGRLNERYGIGLGRQTRWTGYIDGAARARQAGTAVVLAASGLQAPNVDSVSPLYLYHAVNALRMVGLEYQARMIAAEALARTGEARG